mgnify:CR=1 FL=1
MRSKRNGSNGDRARQTVAQEAARLIVDHGIRDFRVAKTKAAERLGISGRGSLPGNAEIELAVSEHLSLFGGDSHAAHLGQLREAALAAIDGRSGNFILKLKMEFLTANSVRADTIREDGTSRVLQLSRVSEDRLETADS